MSNLPFTLFDDWFAKAKASEPNDPNAMALATANSKGAPSVRMVLLKGHSPQGFVFYTNTQSRKGEEISANPQAALLFHWKSLHRQIRIEGALTQVTDDVADGYFASRARDSQLGAWASDQSRPLDERATFAARLEAYRQQYEGQDIPRPPHWTGFCLTPQTIEFWEDRDNRLHHRRQFILNNMQWNEGLLYP
ncbi:pyridoxamine 5'-phosphate oxidase [Parasphingorhabdus sp. DH2-15]|uniref:pyridoxamine 5'-phosphate oxidase n=1 Tax=Parasphingorhabdus sp. DH2-15 TaxID=3444112 RepID=UPI003F6852ED